MQYSDVDTIKPGDYVTYDSPLFWRSYGRSSWVKLRVMDVIGVYLHFLLPEYPILRVQDIETLTIVDVSYRILIPWED